MRINVYSQELTSEVGTVAAVAPLEPLPTEAMIAKGAHVLSEWLDDAAPLNERRYREPAKAAFVAMTAEAPL